MKYKLSLFSKTLTLDIPNIFINGRLLVDKFDYLYQYCLIVQG